jgi:hypothetical protein
MASQTQSMAAPAAAPQPGKRHASEWARPPEERRQPLPPHPAEVTTERATDAVDHVLGLALPAQLGVLRTIAPKILARLDDDARRGFVRDLDTEIFLALQGVPTYDLRHGRAQ